MDVDSIEPGVDYGEAIDEAVGSCDVLLAVIGSKWVDAVDEYDRRRLDDPDDLVLLEIATALQRNVRVIPVLVDGTPPPRRNDLPDALGPLARRHAVPIEHALFNATVANLLAALDRALAFERTRPGPEKHPDTGRSSNVNRSTRADEGPGTAGKSSTRSNPTNELSTSPEFELKLRKEGITATARVIDGVFTVHEGSLARHSWVGTDSTYKQLRESLERDGTLAPTRSARLMRFTRNHAFASPSAASAVVVGRSSNGRDAWRTRDGGLTYGDWQSGGLPPKDLFS
jgi:hypothetical protein